MTLSVEAATVELRETIYLGQDSLLNIEGTIDAVAMGGIDLASASSARIVSVVDRSIKVVLGTPWYGDAIDPTVNRGSFTLQVRALLSSPVCISRVSW